MSDSSDTVADQYAARAKEVLGYSRWWQILAAAAMMGMVSPYQYVWSSIEGPLARSLNVPLPRLGIVFTLFVIFQAGSQFPAGWWRDRHGPRTLVLLAGVLVGVGFVGLAYATELWQLYVLYSTGAVGVGIVYTVAVNTAIKWFPDRRGLTTGIGTMAFAAGSAFFIPYVRANATVAAHDDVLRTMGVVMGTVILAGAFVLRDPPDEWVKEPGAPGDTDPAETSVEETATQETAVEEKPSPSYTWREMIRTWQFWWMYVMFVLVSGAGLMLTAKIVSFAETQGLAASVATAAAFVLPIAGGIGRLLVGGASDRGGRKRMMAVSFVLVGVGLFAVVGFSQAGFRIPFVVAVVVATFFWSPQYTLFPSIVGDYYGEQYSSGNYALLYSGKMWGGVFGGAVTGWLIVTTSWTTTFLLGGVLAIVAGVGALFLRPPDDRGDPQEVESAERSKQSGD